MATKKAAKKTTTGGVPAGSRKRLDKMSESHRNHINFWEPHKENMGARYVWTIVRRFVSPATDGPWYVMVKRGDKDYAILSYDTSKPAKVTPKGVLDEGFETSGACLETFKDYRAMAKIERSEARTKASPSKPKKIAKPKASSAAAEVTATAKGKAKKVRKPPVRKAAPKRKK